MNCWTFAAVLIAFSMPALTANADDYPSRPIHAIASQGPGGLSDLFMRALGDQLGPMLSTSIVVEDHAGADGTVGAKACAAAAPDGYTICIITDQALVINPFLPDADFDPAKTLVPIARPYYLTQMFAVSTSLGVKTFPELAALIKSKPGTFNYMAASLSKVAFMQDFNQKNGTDVVRLPFKGGGDAVNAMLNGSTQIAIFGIGNLISYIQADKITGLAIDGDERSPLDSSIPTFKEAGYTQHISATFFGIMAPTGTPLPIIEKLNKAIVAVESKPDFQQKFLISRGLSPNLESAEQFAKELVADRVEGLSVVKASGLYPDVK
ncbi:MAG: tripartite tricarboxylate transporter substrate binding protein [Xanthobacteraceae bacterium]|jgi:tripartite-type tricarboxylate transporter receptor subunit TctC